MSVYVDKLRYWPPSSKWSYPASCHLYADSVEELHRFAESLGLKRSWFQDRPRFPHYDLTASKRKLALKKGAKEKEIMRKELK